MRNLLLLILLMQGFISSEVNGAGQKITPVSTTAWSENQETEAQPSFVKVLRQKCRALWRSMARPFKRAVHPSIETAERPAAIGDQPSQASTPETTVYSSIESFPTPRKHESVLIADPYHCKDKDEEGMTGLHHLAQGPEALSSLATFLIESGANPNEIDRHGRTPAHYAAAAGNLSFITALIEAKANFSIRDHHFKTALDTTDMNGRTPLHHAALQGNRELYRWLIGRGAKANLKDKSERSAESYLLEAEKSSLEDGGGRKKLPRRPLRPVPANWRPTQ